MPENPHLRFLLRLCYLLLALALGWLFLTVLLPWVLPFLLALLFAWALERPVAFLTRKLRLRRWLSAAVCTLGLVLVIAVPLLALVWRGGYELSLLLGRLPALLSGVPTLGKHLEEWVYRFVVALPVPFQEVFQDALDHLLEQGLALPSKLYDALAGIVSGAFTVVPGVMLFLFTTALATYFTSAGRPELLSLFSQQLPQSWQQRLSRAGEVLRRAWGDWLRAQGILMLVTFGELTLGFLLLRVDYFLLLAALVALVDALPVFGTGTVLLPWAVGALLTRRWKLSLGLAALYGLVSLVRSLLEPKLVADHAGLPPLAALFAMYVGFCAFGVWGMIFAPLGAIFLKQLHDSGVVRLWREQG